MIRTFVTQSMRWTRHSSVPYFSRKSIYPLACKTCIASFSSSGVERSPSSEPSPFEKNPITDSPSTSNFSKDDEKNASKSIHSDPSIDTMRTQLLTKALELVPQYSFSQMAIHQAAHVLNFPLTLAGLVPNGPKDLIEFLMDQGIIAIHEAHQELIGTSAVPCGMTKTVTHLTRKRLEFMKPYIRQWPDALRFMTYPTQVVFGISQLHRLVDEIWHLAGDQSFDMNYYTKRALLGSVYSSTELYMIRDTSEDFHKTFEFMNARFQNTKQLGDLVKSSRETLDWGFRNVAGIFNSR